MPLGTPKHRATLWVFANAAWIAVSPAAALYFDHQQRNGAYPVDADSIGLPIMGIAVWVIVLLLPLNFVWWFFAQRSRVCPSNGDICDHCRILRGRVS